MTQLPLDVPRGTMPNMDETRDRETRTAQKERARVDVLHREDRVLSLRLAGWSYDRIAIEVGYANRGVAQKAHERAIARIPARNATLAKDEAVERALHMIAVWMPLASNGDLDADRRLHQWEDRLAKLQGTDAPTRVQVMPSEVDAQIEALCATLDVRAATTDQPA